MKNITFIIALLALPILAIAQMDSSESSSEVINENKKSNHIEFLSDTPSSHGIYFGIGSSLAHLGSNDFVGLESRLAYISDQKFELGIAGEIFHNINRLVVDPDSSTYMAGAFGGFHLKAIFNGNKKIHFAIPLLFGGGSTSVYTDFDRFEDIEDSWAAFLFIQPGANLELNINRILGFEFGAKYMLTTNSDINERYYKNLNGFKIHAMLKIGIFGLGHSRNKEKKEIRSQSNKDYLDL